MLNKISKSSDVTEWCIIDTSLHTIYEIRYGFARCFCWRKVSTPFIKGGLYYTKPVSGGSGVILPSCLQEVGKVTLLSWHLAKVGAVSQNVRHELHFLNRHVYARWIRWLAISTLNSQPKNTDRGMRTRWCVQLQHKEWPGGSRRSQQVIGNMIHFHSDSYFSTVLEPP